MTTALGFIILFLYGCFFIFALALCKAAKMADEAIERSDVDGHGWTEYPGAEPEEWIQ